MSLFFTRFREGWRIVMDRFFGPTTSVNNHDITFQSFCYDKDGPVYPPTRQSVCNVLWVFSDHGVEVYVNGKPADPREWGTTR